MNQALEDFNKQLRETIRLLENEERLINKRKSITQKEIEQKIIDEIKRYT